MMNKIRFFLTTIILCTVFAFSALALYEDGEGIYSDNVYMENLNTGRVVMDIGADEKVYPASLTKILTCLLAIEKCEDLSEVYVIPSGIFDDIYAQGGANISLKAGEEITISDLIHATLIRSACDSATALAYYVSGSVDAFAEEMNSRAKEIGAANTHFTNAHGLHDPNHYTTARDLAIIAKFALQNKTFYDIISKWNYTIPETNMSSERYFESTMELEIPDNDSYYEFVTGVKSGFTDEAGRCLVTYAEKDGEKYLLVTLGANRDRYYLTNMAYTDAVNLYEYCFACYSIDKIIEKDVPLTSISVNNGISESVSLVSDEDISYLCAVDETVEVVFNLPESISAPIDQGDEIGSATVKISDVDITKPLYASQSIAKAKKSALVTDNSFLNFLNITAVSIYVISFATLVLFCYFFFKKKKHK